MVGKNSENEAVDHSDLIFFLLATGIIISPLILLRLASSSLGELWKDTSIANDGFVFVASTGILTRLLLRSSLRVTIRAGLRSGIRTGGRTAIRSAIKERGRVMGKAYLARFSRRLFSEDMSSQNSRENLIKLSLTAITLVGSFMMVTFLHDSRIYFWASFLVIIPITVIYAGEAIASRLLGADFNFYFTKDGFAIQLLFSLGMSFIPLANDTNINEDDRKKGIVSLSGWFFVLVLSLITANLYQITGSEIELFGWLSNFSLLFLLVIAIPIDPLEGKDIYNWRPFVGLAVLIISLGVSLFYMQADFTKYI